MICKKGDLWKFLSEWPNKYGTSRDAEAPSQSVAPDYVINMIFREEKINGVPFTTAEKTKVMVKRGKRIREKTQEPSTTMTWKEIQNHTMMVK